MENYTITARDFYPPNSRFNAPHEENKVEIQPDSWLMIILQTLAGTALMCALFAVILFFMVVLSK